MELSADNMDGQDTKCFSHTKLKLFPLGEVHISMNPNVITYARLKKAGDFKLNIAAPVQTTIINLVVWDSKKSLHSETNIGSKFLPNLLQYKSVHCD